MTSKCPSCGMPKSDLKHMCDECYIEYKKGLEEMANVSRETSEKVYQPEHYSFGTYECINVIRDVLSGSGYIGYLNGNIFKYLWRWEHKNGLEDLQKARHYLDMLIKEVSGNEGK